MRKIAYDKNIITREVLQTLIRKGFSRPEIAKQFGVTRYAIERAESDYGLSRPRRGAGRKPWDSVSEKYLESHREQFEHFLALHNQGKTFTEIAEECGCSSAHVGKQFKVFGYSFDNSYKTAAAHAAVRGMKRTQEDLERRALGKQRKHPKFSRWESEFADWLTSNGIGFTPSKAVGKYNIDFAIGDSIAVELFGGAYHATGRAAARLHERMSYLIGRGWSVYIIWCLSKESCIFPGCFDDFSAFMQSASRDKSGIGEYRVVWSDGDFVSAGRSESDYLTAIMPPRMRHNALSKYKTAGD